MIHKICNSMLFLVLLVAAPALAQELPQFGSLEELESYFNVDLPDDYDWENFTPAALGPGFGTPAVGTPPGTVNCFDYYEFNSVGIDVTNQVDYTIPGDQQEFIVSLTNKNPYPLVDGKLFVKIFRERTDNVDTQINGDHLIDSFVALDGLNLQASSTSEYSFTWEPARYLPSGGYYVASYFITSDSFNLAGLSFTDDIIGSRGEFTVGGHDGAFYFDKDNVVVNAKDYQFVGAPPRVHESNPVVIKAPIKNETATDGVGMVYWKIYYWDAQKEEHLIETRSEAVMVPSGESVVVDYLLTDNQHAVYLVEPALVFNAETVSKLNVRLVRMGVDEPRINFPSLMSFPVAAGETNTLFSCLHNSGLNPVVTNTKMTLVLKDVAGNEVLRTVYEGDTSGAMMAIAEEFTPERSYNYLTLTATLEEAGEVVDEAMIVYDCNEIDPEQCLDITEADASDDSNGSPFSSKVIWIGLALCGMLLVGGLVFFLVRRNLSAKKDK